MPARTCAAAALCLLHAASASSQSTPPHRLPGVEASRVVVEARVVDGRNRPIAGLGAGDFAAEVDGRPAPIESVTWVDQAQDAGGSARPPGPTPADGTAPAGRRLLLLFQKDARGSRLLGLLRSTHHAAGIVATLGPRDAAAVLVHDSRLRLHLDWTRDPRALARALSGSVLQRWPEPIAPATADSLAALLDPDDAREAASIELALLALGRALRPIPGEKAVVLFGWGFGQQWQGTYSAPDYGPARDALDRARVTVFAVDFVDADYHTLELGLRQVARDTGGVYLKTNDHPDLALRRVSALLAGHYVIAFERPSAARGEHRLALSLVGRRGTVLARSTYVD